MNNFYTKTRETNNDNILDCLTINMKLDINWKLISKGTDVNKVFSLNPMKLDDFLCSGKLRKNYNTEKDSNVKRLRAGG